MFRVVLNAGFLALSVFLFVACPARVASGHGDEGPHVLRIGIVSSLFRDVPESQIGSGRQIFSVLMRAQTGLSNELSAPVPADELAEELAKGHLDLAIFQGVEFAWARQKHPELRPLLIIVNQRPYRQAHLIVRQDCAATGWADLANRVLAVPARSREHCYLFLERHCRKYGHESAHFFARVVGPFTVEDALDDVVDGHAHAAVIDGVGLDAYKRRKPGCFAKLKELQKSELFPDSVVAFRTGAIGAATLRRCSEGLLKAQEQYQGRLLLMLWMVTSFEPLPQDFDRRLAEIGKAYPATMTAHAGRPKKPASAKSR